MESCPCCSGNAFRDCCEPFLSDRKAPETALELMRARYAAYTRADLNFLYASSGPRVRREFDAKATRRWAETATWQGLEILATNAGGAHDTQGTVEFVAHYTIGGKPCHHREVAGFRRINDQWRFHDGRVVGPDPRRREEPKTGRNEPCPCGSGRKFKRCCEPRKHTAADVPDPAVAR